MQQQLGDQFSELAANENYMKTMRQQVLNRLIDEALLDQYARELGLNISDDREAGYLPDPGFPCGWQI